MPRLIFKCPYIKGGTSAATAHLENYVKYMVRGLKKSNDGTTVIRLGNIMYTIQMQW